jgi:hypothetical protein
MMMANLGCAMCFRKLTAQRWTTCKPDVIGTLVRTDQAPYAKIVLQRLEQLLWQGGAASGGPPLAAAEALLCDYCACFIKERTVRYTPREGNGSGGAVQVRKGRKHGMHMAIEHVLSGGSMPSPSRPHFLRCLAILEQPAHPFMAVEHGVLGERLCGRKRIFGQDDCVVRWLFEGRPHIFVDPVLAKNMRRWISLQGHTNAMADSGGSPSSSSPSSEEREQQEEPPLKKEMWQQQRWRRRRRRGTAAPASPTSVVFRNQGIWDAPLPAACRFCVRASDTGAATAMASSYAGALTFGRLSSGAIMEAALLEIERVATDTVLEPGLCVYCLQCHRVATISFEYSRALRALLGLETGAIEAAEDTYYARQITLFHERRGRV